MATVIIDEERAPHIRWAFEAYATGEWSIGRLAQELDERGLRSRPRRRTGVPIPLKKNSVHQMLRNKYYLGIVTYKGDEYEGIHEPLIDAELFDQVQDLLAARRNSHTKYRVHDHFLKGSIFCRRCDQRFYYRQVTKKSGATYEYFLCRGRNERQGCPTPHLSVDLVEDKVADVYRNVFLTPERLRRLRELLQDEATKHDEDRDQVIAAQEARLTRLLQEEQKNTIAYQADALSLDVLKLELAKNAPMPARSSIAPPPATTTSPP